MADKTYEQLKKEYDELENSYKKTEKALHIVDNKIKDLNEKLLKSESMKMTFISNLKNELNDPLSSLFALSSSLIKEEQVDQDYMKEVGKIFYKELSNLYQKISNIFAAADIEAGEIEIHSSRIDIKKFVFDIIEMFENSLQEKHLTLNFKIVNDEDIFFITDSAKLHLVLMNLLGNSIFYTKENSTIELKVWRTENNLNIVLEDYGEFFDEEKVNNDFLEILSLGIESNKAGRGENLSVSIMKMMIELLGGTLDIAESDRGTIIAVFLPEFNLETNEMSSDGNEIFFDDDTEVF